MPGTRRRELTQEAQHFFYYCLSGFTILIIKMLLHNLCFFTMSVITMFFFPQHLSLPVIIDSRRCCISAFPVCVFPSRNISITLLLGLQPYGQLSCSTQVNPNRATLHTNSGIICMVPLPLIPFLSHQE